MKAQCLQAIDLEELWPGEAALSSEKVGDTKRVLAAGGRIDPVNVVEIAGRKIVRDGNNRVRALVEHSEALHQAVPCVTGEDPPPTPHGREILEVLAAHYGKGRGAFLKMPVAGAGEYEKVQERVARDIWQARAGRS